MIIQTTNLTMDFGDTRALDALNLTIEGDRIVGLLGRNGSGKTTLMSLLAAFMKPTAGEITINGQPVWENEAITSQISLIRDAGDTVEESEPVKQAFAYSAYLRENWDTDFAQRILEAFEVNPKSKLESLSKGKRSAVGIALGLGARAPLTMLDETYLGLDAPSRYRFYDLLLNDFMEHPRTIILSTHLIEEVSTVFEDVVIIDRGRLLLHEPLEEVLQRGHSITGPADAVNAIAKGLQVVGERQLGNTKSATIIGEITAEQHQFAHENGLQFDPVPLQDLFVHLTDPKGMSS